MNAELKAMMVIVFSVVKFIEDLIAKDGIIQEISDLEPVMLGVPAVITNWKDLGAEVKALTNAQNEQDLAAFIAAQFGTVSSNPHIGAVVNAALKLVQDVPDVVALVQAIKALK